MADEMVRLSLQQVAEWLHVSDSTVRRMLDSGDLAGYKVGRRWWFDEAAVEQYRTSQATARRDYDNQLEHERADDAVLQQAVDIQEQRRLHLRQLKRENTVRQRTQGKRPGA